MTTYIKEKDIDNNINEIIDAIKSGKTIVFKTDTVYGIGANAYDAGACKKIYDIKNRPKFKPLCVLISNISMLTSIVESISPVEQKMIDAFWPGPLTILFRKRVNALPEVVALENEYIGVRLIHTGVAYKLIEASGVPLVAPSANLSGSRPKTKLENIRSELDGKVDYILDSGNINDDTTSTIVKVQNEKVIIIREGKIKKEEIEKIVPMKI